MYYECHAVFFRATKRPPEWTFRGEGEGGAILIWLFCWSAQAKTGLARGSHTTILRRYPGILRKDARPEAESRSWR